MRRLTALAVLAVFACADEPVPESEPAPEATAVEQPVPEPDPLPEYRILDRTRLMGGGAHGDVLVESYSRETPAGNRREALRRIMSKEGLSEAALYCSEDAMRASYSSSYAEAHPSEVERCAIGVYVNGRFSSYDDLYPDG